MSTLIPVLLFYYQQIALGSTSPALIKDFIAIEALVIGVEPRVAVGIANAESQLNSEAIGDHNTSFGLYQIHLPAHKEITVQQAHDIIFSTEWSLNEMKQNGCKIWSTCDNVMKRPTGGT